MEKLILAKLIVSIPYLIWLAVSDWKHRVLPNVGTIGGSIVMMVATLAISVDYFLDSLLAAFLCSLFLLLPFLVRAAGAGDVKMMFAAGLIAGPGNVLNLILFVSLSGLILAIVMMFTRKVNTARLRHYMRCLFDFRYDRAAGKKALPPSEKEECRIPFGVAIAMGLFLNLLLQYLFILEITE